MSQNPPKKRGRPPKGLRSPTYQPHTAVRDARMQTMNQAMRDLGPSTQIANHPPTKPPDLPDPTPPPNRPTATGASSGSNAGSDLPPLPFAPVDTPPESRRGPGRPAKESVEQRVHTFLVSLYGGTGLLLGMVNQYDGMVVASQAGPAADAWMKLARQDKRVMHVLDLLASNNTRLMLAMAHLAIIVPIAVNHQLMPRLWASRFGVPEPPAPEPQPSPEPTFAQGAQVGGPFAGFTPEQVTEIQRQATERAQAMMQASTVGVAATGQESGYNPADAMPRPEQNPALLGSLLARRG